ncbi:hypothetical protein U716_14990 [Rhodobacter capsulatus B6]|nr:hypothetical protein U716_14990 [Rhodobacter capsulatus B6]
MTDLTMAGLTRSNPFKIALNAREAANALSLTLPEFERLVACGSLPRPVFLGPEIPRWRCADLEAVLCGGNVVDEEFEP